MPKAALLTITDERPLVTHIANDRWILYRFRIKGFRMLEKLKEIGWVVGGVVMLVAIVSLPVVFIMGSVWASENILPPLIPAGWIVLAIDFLVFLPLSLFERLRGFTGGAIYLSSFVFGLIAWLFGFILTYTIWGLTAVIIGLIFMGGGVVPMAMLATAVNGYWEPFFIVFCMGVLTFATRMFGMHMMEISE